MQNIQARNAILNQYPEPPPPYNSINNYIHTSNINNIDNRLPPPPYNYGITKKPKKSWCIIL